MLGRKEGDPQPEGHGSTDLADEIGGQEERPRAAEG